MLTAILWIVAILIGIWIMATAGGLVIAVIGGILRVIALVFGAIFSNPVTAILFALSIIIGCIYIGCSS